MLRPGLSKTLLKTLLDASVAHRASVVVVYSQRHAGEPVLHSVKGKPELRTNALFSSMESQLINLLLRNKSQRTR